MPDLKSQEAVQTLDILGKVCPYTLLLTKKALETMAGGAVLKVLCNHRAAVKDTIPKYCKKQEFEFEVVELRDKGYWEIYIRKPY